jgi:hypothetical protein
MNDVLLFVLLVAWPVLFAPAWLFFGWSLFPAVRWRAARLAGGRPFKLNLQESFGLAGITSKVLSLSGRIKKTG